MVGHLRYARQVTPAAPSNVPSDITVTLSGGPFSTDVFDGALAVDKGDYTGEFVRQKSYLVTNVSQPDVRVWIRVDADSSGNRIVAPGTGWRDEVIVEYGRSQAGTPLNIKTTYTATIRKNGSIVAQYTVPVHWWYSRWRYQSSERSVVRTPTTLKSRKWIPNFDANGLFGKTANTTSVAWTGPFGDPFPGERAMGGSGDNIHIGLLTEYQADYVLYSSAASLTSLRTEAEWVGNWQICVRDDTTMAPVDCLTVTSGNSTLIAGFGQGQPNLKEAPLENADTTAGYVSIEAAHWYPCAAFAWMLTDDPFFLESMQFGANWHLLWNYYHRVHESLPGIVYPGETRAYAWGMREMFWLAAISPTSVPSWLRPRSYWVQAVGDCKTFINRYVNNTKRMHSLFRLATQTNLTAAWQRSWLTTVIGHAIDLGFTDWSTIYAWIVDYHIQMTNGTSGWSRQWPVPFYHHPLKGVTTTALYADGPQWFQGDADAQTCTSWADAWAYYTAGESVTGFGSWRNVGAGPGGDGVLDTTGWDGTTIMERSGTPSAPTGPSYLFHLRATIAMAATRGVTGAQSIYTWLQDQITTNVVPSYGGTTGQARFSIDPVSATTTAEALISAAPSNSWVNLSATGNKISDVFVNATQYPFSTGEAPTGVIGDWGAACWDSLRKHLLVFGGGHAGYSGNEVYRWRSDTLNWERCSLPSDIVLIDAFPMYKVKDGYLNAPLATHTYDNNAYLSTVDRMITLGGANVGTGAHWLRDAVGALQTGPYLWDPSKADPRLTNTQDITQKVGGTANSDRLSSAPGGAMWQNRDNFATSGLTTGMVGASSDTNVEGGKDCVYFCNAAKLVKLTINDVTNPSLDTYSLLGDSNGAFGGSITAGALRPPVASGDPGFYVAICNDGNYTFWDLLSPNSSNPFHHFTPAGSGPSLGLCGIVWDSLRSRFLLWNGTSQVWALTPPTRATPSTALPTTGWTVAALTPTSDGRAITPTAPAQSQGNWAAGSFLGVIGKWMPAYGAGAFVGVIDPTNGTVWAYKP